MQSRPLRPARPLRGAAPAVILALAGAILLSVLGTASASAAELPEFNLLGLNGGSDITQMNMSTGEFSGTAEIDGEHFTIEGTETGHESTSVFTWIEEPAYKSTNTDFYEILANGNVGGEGSFSDTKGTHETYFGEIDEPEATVPSKVSLSCTNTDMNFTAYSCTATVAGSGGVPTGNITMSASSGSFPSASQCVLTAGSCSVSYQTPATGLASPITLTAVYSADATFKGSQGTGTLCGSGGVSVTAATPRSSDPDGIVPGDTLKLTGKGLCPGMSVQVGNEKAVVSVLGAQVAADGTSATLTVPRLATTGTLTVKSAGQSAALAEPVTIDSFRNTSALSFHNIPAYDTTLAEFEAAFGAGNVTYITGSDPVDNLTPRAHAAFEHFRRTSFADGLCFGWVFSALHFDAGELSLAGYDPDATIPFDLSLTPALESLIATEFWKQFSDQYQAWRRGAAGQLNSVPALETALDPGLGEEGERPEGVPMTLFFYSANGASNLSALEAHEVIAYATETQPAVTPGEPEQLLIYVADPNIQFESGEDSTDGGLHSEHVDTSVVKVSYTSDGQYTATYRGRPVGVEASPRTVTNGSLTPWAPKGVLTSWISPTGHLEGLRAGTGKKLTVGDAEEGVFSEPIVNEDSPVTESFTAPLGAYSETLSGAGEIGDLIETSELSAEVEASPGTDDVSVEPETDTIGVEPASGAGAARATSRGHAGTASPSKTATITLIASQANHSERTASVTGPAGEALSIDHGTLTVTNHTARAAAVTLLLGSNAGTPQEFRSASVSVPPRGRLTARPDWGSLERALTVTLTGGRRRTLANVERPPAATITRLKAAVSARKLSVGVQVHVPALSVGSGVSVELQLLSGGRVSRTFVHRLAVPARAGVLSFTQALGAPPAGRATLRATAITSAAGPAVTLARRERTTSLR